MIRLRMLGAIAAAPLLIASAGSAQTMPDVPDAPAAVPPPAAPPAGMSGMDMSGAGMSGMNGMGSSAATAMRGMMGGSMRREASGTSWQPEVSAPGAGMGDMAMSLQAGWTLMGHAQLFAVYDDQGGRRGDDKGYVAGMLMGQASRAWGPGQLTLRGMISPDPFMGKSGYPLLLATGETADGRTPLVDRQHPHDLVAELAATYSLPVAQGRSVFVYVAPVGEPALGPPAFMHRSSGQDIPSAPITHHWLDSTHISYGVVTAGVVLNDVKLELSGFRGREPDQHRFDIEAPKLDSVAARATWNPSPRWSLQASYGRLHSPEQLQPERDEDRFTASLAYARPVFSAGAWSSTVAFGRKSLSDGGRDLDAALAESELVLGPHWTVLGRAEWKEDDELAPSGAVYRVGELGLGAIRDFPLGAKTTVGLGVIGSVYAIPGGLKPLYGAAPLSGMLFLRLRAG